MHPCAVVGPKPKASAYADLFRDRRRADDTFLGEMLGPRQIPMEEYVGFVRPTYARRKFIHASFTHHGSSPSVSGRSGRHVQPFEPARTVSKFQFMTAACCEIDAGPARLAFAITSC
jgi:hypothetical protein